MAWVLLNILFVTSWNKTYIPDIFKFYGPFFLNFVHPTTALSNMGVGKWIVLLFRPRDFKTLLEFALYYKPKRDITAVEEHPTSGWDRESMRRCWQLLDMTSRSFATVIKEADGDLARTVSASFITALLNPFLDLEDESYLAFIS